MDDDTDSRSFWVTVPGLITAIGGLITGIGVLIGALSAANVIGSDASATANDIPSSNPSKPYTQAVLHGTWDVQVTIQHLNGSPGGNSVWVFQNPAEGDHDDETWTLESQCASSPCTTDWSSSDAPSKFSQVEFDGESYTASKTSTLSVCIEDTKALRVLRMNVTYATYVDGVWTATAFDGDLRINWDCAGTTLSAVLAITGTRTDT